METKITFCRTINGRLIFRLNDHFDFKIRSNDNGVIDIEFLGHPRIEILACEIVNWFKQGSNEGLKAINFNSEGVCIHVTAKSANRDRIVKRWYRKMKEQQKMQQKQREEYLKSPEYLKAKYRLQIVRRRVSCYVQNEDFEFKNENARQQWLNFFDAISDDPYTLSVTNYALCWAKLMQYIMHKYKGVTVEQIAKATSKAANMEESTDKFIYHMSVTLLMNVWKYGSELVQWYNKECDYKGNGHSQVFCADY